MRLRVIAFRNRCRLCYLIVRTNSRTTANANGTSTIIPHKIIYCRIIRTFQICVEMSYTHTKSLWSYVRENSEHLPPLTFSCLSAVTFILILFQVATPFKTTIARTGLPKNRKETKTAPICALQRPNISSKYHRTTSKLQLEKETNERKHMSQTVHAKRKS